MNLEEIREKYPQYSEVSDGDLLMGLHRKFYPDMHPRAFLNAIDGAANAHVTIKDPALKEYWRSKVQQPMEGESEVDVDQRLYGKPLQEQVSTGGAAMNAARGAFQGMTFGFGDEIVARGVSTLKGTEYEVELERERARLDMGREENPVASYGSEIAGAIAAPTAMAAQVVGRGAPLARVGKGAVVGAAEGGLYGFGAGEGGVEERVKNGAVTAAVGGVVGGAAPFVQAGASRAVKASRHKQSVNKAIKDAPSLHGLEEGSQKIFRRADKVQGLERRHLSDAAPGIVDRAERAGMDEILTPQADRAVNRMVDAATDPNPNIGFRELDVLRRQAQVPAGNVSNNVEAAIGSKLVKSVDDVLAKSDAGTSKEVAEARKMWGQLRRHEVIEEAIEKAQNQASGFENGLRVQFRAILSNAKKRKGFSKEELKAIAKVVKGTPVSNAMKKIGKLGVGVGQQSNALMASLGAAGGTAVGGPVVGLAIPAIGTAAQKLSERSTRKAAEAAGALVRSGGVEGVNALAAPQRVLLENALRQLAQPSAVVVNSLAR